MSSNAPIPPGLPPLDRHGGDRGAGGEWQSPYTRGEAYAPYPSYGPGATDAYGPIEAPGGGADMEDDTGTWAALTREMERVTTQSVALPRAGDAAPPSHAPNPWDLNSDLLDDCRIELESVTRELDELRLLLTQSSREVESLNYRKTITAAAIRQIEERLELYSRQDIRTAYLAAAEAEMRAFMIGEQRSQFQAKVRAYERYEQFLKRAIAALATLALNDAWLAAAGVVVGAPQAPELPALDAPQADDQPPYMEAQAREPLREAIANAPTMLLEDEPAEAAPHVSDPSSVAASQAWRRGATLSDPVQERATLSRILQAQEEVRQRVAQRLHDGPTQSLANVLLTAEICEKLSGADPARAARELGNLKALVNATLQETRKFIFELRPMTLDDLGLPATLRRYAADVAAKYQAQIPLTLPAIEPRLPSAITAPVFRVAQEALLNALEHGRATRIHITLALPPGGLALIVEDNGIGFDASEALARADERQTLGLIGMRERAEALGGALRVQSAPGRGCLVELRIPLPA